jgi:hypothetical protein
MSDAQCLARLTRTLVYLEQAFAQLEGVDGMDSVQYEIAGLLMDVEMQADELTSIG